MTPDISRKSPEVFTHTWICTTYMCPHICKHIHTHTQRNGIRKKNLDRKPKIYLPRVKKTAGNSGSSDSTTVAAVSEPTNGPSAAHELLASPSKPTELSTVSLHTNRQGASTLKECTHSYAAEPGQQFQCRHQVKLSGGKQEATHQPQVLRRRGRGKGGICILSRNSETWSQNERNLWTNRWWVSG